MFFCLFFCFFLHTVHYNIAHIAHVDIHSQRRLSTCSPKINYRHNYFEFLSVLEIESYLLACFENKNKNILIKYTIGTVAHKTENMTKEKKKG